MTSEIPDSIKAQYKKVVSKLRGGYLNPNTYQSKVMNTKNSPLEVNKWYIIDLEGSLNNYNWFNTAFHLELIYTIGGSMSTSVTVYYVGIENPFTYKHTLFLPPLTFYEGYGIPNLNYIPIEINDYNMFINWIGSDPMEVKE
jgi:hypothetical protein